MAEYKVIPKFHKGSDPEYWEDIFPKMYNHRTITVMDWFENDEKPLIADGDLVFEVNANGKHIPRCLGCDTLIKKLKPRMFGSLDVGYELIYECPNCGAKSRVYSQVL